MKNDQRKQTNRQLFYFLVFFFCNVCANGETCEKGENCDGFLVCVCVIVL